MITLETLYKLDDTGNMYIKAQIDYHLARGNTRQVEYWLNRLVLENFQTLSEALLVKGA